MKTRLKLGLVLGMIFLFGNAFGQTNELPEQNQGSQAGPSTYLRLMINLVNTTVNSGPANGGLWDYKTSRRGLQAGASLQAGITSRVSLLTEFYFLVKGGPVKTNDQQTDDKTTFRFYTLELPVLARFHFGQFHINAGPSLAYNLAGKKKTGDTSSSLSFNDSSDGFKRLDAGIQVGGGYRFQIKQKKLALDIRYSHGLSNISRVEEMYNRYLNISLQVINPWKVNPLARGKNSN